MSFKQKLWFINIANWQMNTPSEMTQAELLAFYDQRDYSGLKIAARTRDGEQYTSANRITTYSPELIYNGDSYSNILSDPVNEIVPVICLNLVSACAEQIPSSIRNLSTDTFITKENFLETYGDYLMLDLKNFNTNLQQATIRPISIRNGNTAQIYQGDVSVNLGWGEHNNFGGIAPLLFGWHQGFYNDLTYDNAGKFNGECKLDLVGLYSAFDLYEGYLNINKFGTTYSNWKHYGDENLIPKFEMGSRTNIYLFEKAIIDEIIQDLNDIGVSIAYFEESIMPDSSPESGQDENENNPGGGTGKWEIDTIAMPDNPGSGAALFSNTYALNYRQMLSLSSYIWSDGDIKSILLNAGNTNAISAIKGAYILPFNLDDYGTTVNEIVMGNYAIIRFSTDPEEFNKLNYLNQIDLDFGNLTIEPKYGSFLDYEPYTTMQIYLPYCGIQNIEAGLVYGKELNLKYLINLESGEGRALIYVDGSPIYNWPCQLGIPISFNKNDINDKIRNTAMGVAGIGIAALSGGIGGGIAAGTVAGAAGKMTTQLSNDSINLAGLQQITTIGATGGGTDRQMPQEAFIIIKSTKSFVPQNYNHIIGRPSLVVKPLSELEGKGLTIIEEPIIDFSTGTEQERLNLIKAMQEGIIL